MKAFEIVWSKMPESTGIYAALTAGKAKYHAASLVVEAGYKYDEGEVFPELTCCRRPDLDVWASQFNKTTSVDSEFLYCDLSENPAIFRGAA